MPHLGVTDKVSDSVEVAQPVNRDVGEQIRHLHDAPTSAPKRMVCPVDVYHVEPGPQMKVDQIGAGEGVPCATHHQGGDPDGGKVVDAEALGTAGGMQGVGVQHEGSAVEPIGDEHRRHPPTHRPAAEDHLRPDLPTGPFGDCPVGGHQFGWTIWPSPTGGRIRIVEGDDGEAAACEGVAERHHRRVVLVGSRPVSQDEDQITITTDPHRNGLSRSPFDGSPTHRAESDSAPTANTRPSRRAFFSTFPVGLRGSSSVRSSQWVGTLNDARWAAA